MRNALQLNRLKQLASPLMVTAIAALALWSLAIAGLNLFDRPLSAERITAQAERVDTQKLNAFNAFIKADQLNTNSAQRDPFEQP